MMRAVQRALDVARDRIDSGERRMPGALRSTAGHERLVKAPCLSHRGEAPQAVRLIFDSLAADLMNSG